jgi:hypothetical protein
MTDPHKSLRTMPGRGATKVLILPADYRNLYISHAADNLRQVFHQRQQVRSSRQGHTIFQLFLDRTYRNLRWDSGANSAIFIPNNIVRVQLH